MIDTEKLIHILWKPFLEEIKTGSPVYFCFHREFLNKLFGELSISVPDPVSLINKRANQFLEVDGDDVLLKAEALRPISNGYSAAIVLVCQQILAAEEMVKDSSGFSENAYFPRLRSMISPFLPELSLNPFEFYDFERIWKKFSLEILSVEGSTTETVTFHFGIEQGVNKARHFPLSQSLLSHEDLMLLTHKIGRDRIAKASVAELWSLMKYERQILRRRARGIVCLPFHRDRLVEQLRSFSKKVNNSVLVKMAEMPKSDDEVELLISKDADDFFSDEEYCLHIIKAETKEPISDENTVREIVYRFLEKREYHLLPLSNFGDHWVRNNKNCYLRPKQSVLIFGTEKGVNDAARIVYTLVPTVKLSEKKYPLRGINGVFIQEFLIPDDFKNEIYIRAGGVGITNADTQAPIPYWVGGVCLDMRTDKYLKNALPRGVQILDEFLPIEMMNSVNNTIVTYDSFVGSLENLLEDTSFTIGFANKVSLKLTIGIVRNVDVGRLGYTLEIDTGKLSPIPYLYENEKNNLIGFSNRLPPIERKWTWIQCVILLRGLRNDTGLALSEVQRAYMAERLNANDIPHEVRDTIIEMLNSKRKIEEKVLAQLM